MMRRSLWGLAGLLWMSPIQAMESVLLGGSTGDLSASAVRYVAVTGAGSPNATENNRKTLVGFSGTLSTLRIELTAAPDNGAGTDSYAFIVMIDGGATGPTCTVSETDTACVSTTEVAVTAGQELSIRITPANTPAVVDMQWALSYHGNTTSTPNRISLWPSGTAGSTLATSGITYGGIQGVDVSAVEFDMEAVMPTAGVVKSFYVELSGSPNNGVGTQTYTFTVLQNSSPTAITCAISETATSCNDTSNSFTVAAGDGVVIQAEVTAGTPTARLAWFGLAFEATTDGEFVLAASNDTDTATGATEYRKLQSVGSAVSATETDVQELANAMTFRSVYVETSAAPDNGGGTQDYAFTVRNNAGNTSLACTISESATTCNDTGTDAIAAADDVNISIVPSGTPLAVDVHHSVTGYIAPRRIVLVD